MGIITDWISSLRSKRSADSASELLYYKALAEARRQFEELSGEPIDWTPRKTQLKFLDNLQESGDLAPINKLVNFLIEDAVVRGASDIHIEPCGKSFRVRYRVDGVLSEVMRLPGGLPGGKVGPVIFSPYPYFSLTTGARETVALATGFSFLSRVEIGDGLDTE